MQMKNMVGVLAIEFLGAFGDEPQHVLDNLKGKLTDAREWINNNKESIERLASSVFKLVNVLADLSGSALAVFIKNFGTLIASVTVLRGAKALGGLPGLLKNTQTSVISMFSTFVGKFNLIVATATAANITINSLS